jgi:hypothetical protein
MENKKTKKEVIPSKVSNLFLIILFFASIPSFSQTFDPAFAYHSIHYKGIATINVDDQIFSGQLNFVNGIDSFFYLQLNVAGFEAGRILATHDNILFINKFQRSYYQGDYSFFQNFIDVEIDFFTLQALFNNFDTTVPEDLNLSYEGELVVDDRSFFKTLTCHHDIYPLELNIEIKKITFNNVPKVTATVPKNFSEIKFYETE